MGNDPLGTPHPPVCGKHVPAPTQLLAFYLKTPVPFLLYAGLCAAVTASLYCPQSAMCYRIRRALKAELAAEPQGSALAQASEAVATAKSASARGVASSNHSAEELQDQWQLCGHMIARTTLII